MKKSIIISLLIICCLVNSSYAQKITEPTLAGSWYGGEDFGEFIFHKTELLNYYLKENPNGKIVAKLCSKNRMSIALPTSNGFAFHFPLYTEIIKIPADKVYFARSSKCREKTEQYWFVPENTAIDYDEMVLAKNVKITRLLEDYYDDPDSQPARKEFADNTKQFINGLKNDPKAEGFIILNIKTKNPHFQEAMRQIRKQKLDKNRFRIVGKKRYETHFPEFMIVSINK